MTVTQRPAIPTSKVDLKNLERDLDACTGKANPDYPIHTHPISAAPADTQQGAFISAVGRVTSRRGSIVEIVTDQGRFRVESLADWIHLGDLVQLRGRVVHKADDWILLETSAFARIVPCRKSWPPENIHPYRLTSLHAVVDEKRREKLLVRAKGMQAARSFFHDRGFVHVDTPILRTYEDSNFNATFRTCFRYSPREHILRTSPEDFLRRAVMVFPAVFEIGKSFRNERIDKDHLPEFTHIEFYHAYADLESAIGLVEDLVKTVVRTCTEQTTFLFRGNQIDLLGPWRILTLDEAFQQYVGFRLSEWKLPPGLENAPRSEHVRYFDKILQEDIAPRLVQPTIIRDFPISASLLPDKVDPCREEIKLKAELYIGGLELGEVGTLNNDPDYLYLHNLWCISSRMQPPSAVADWLDWDWLEEFDYGVPPAAGGGIGYERLLQVITGSDDIRDVVWYPFFADPQCPEGITP